MAVSIEFVTVIADPSIILVKNVILTFYQSTLYLCAEIPFQDPIRSDSIIGKQYTLPEDPFCCWSWISCQ